MRSHPFSILPIFRLSRRALVGLFGRVAALTSLYWVVSRAASAGGDAPVAAGTTQGDPEILAGMIHELFPHPGLPPDYYLKTARTVMDRAASAAGTADLVPQGIAVLNALCGNAGWAGAGGPVRLAALQKLESGPFFQFVRAASVELLYRDPQLWELIGYGGNALKRGGYLHHGFNDISWLPPAGKS